MTSKLHHITNLKWEEHRNTFVEPPTLSAFINFLSNRADLLETMEESKPIAIAKSESVTTSNKAKTHSMLPERSLKALTCPMCRQDHFIFACEQFKSLSVQARIKKAQDSNVCMNCLRPGHDTSRCKLGHCKYCRQKHNTLLHIDNDNVLPSAHNTVLSATQSSSSRIILLSTALVRVTDADGNHQTARVLLDSGSTTNFISEDFVRKLHITTYITNTKVTGINSHSSSCSQGCSVSLTSIDDSGYNLNIDCFVLPKVSASVPHAYVDTSNIRIPTNVHLADPTYYIPSSIDILVGAEVFWGIIGSGRIALGTHKPTLLESKLGWLISGTYYHQSDLTSHVCMHINNLQVDLNRFWELDSVSSIHNHTSEERSCEQHFTDNTYRDCDGRFVVTIPFKESPDALGDSYVLAKQRFLSLERRLGRDLRLKNLYVDFINEYIELGHMSESTGHPLDSSYSNYLPHHSVLKESRTSTKLRVVFDASAKTKSGKSFNDIQMVGPTIQDDLLSILLRFRQHKIVISADIEKMYRQTLVHVSNRPLQKILWRAEPTHPLKEYTLNTVTYGTSSAPFLATRCLLQLSEECSDPSTKFSIARDFYVDDFLSGGSSVSEVLEKACNVDGVLRSAKYNLRKWRSNSNQVLQALSGEPEVSDVLNLSDNEQSKTLGLLWKSLSDTFSFSIDINITEKATKRHILSIIAQIFDPVGLVVPCIVEAKIIMQQLWLAKCSWDELVPAHIQYAWKDFQNSLHLLNEFKIPRWVLCDSASRLQLHIFTDASEKAYGACAYVRSVSRDGKVTVHLLTAKSKVAPIKSTTIPRLELCGALLGSRLYSKVRQSLTLRFDEVHCWCDSTIVLGWLATSSNQLKSFVRHRVSEIQETIGGEAWRYVPSAENPADLASRGLRTDRLISSSLWWSGPQFLTKDRSSWPQFPISNHNDSELPETITSCHVSHHIIENCICGLWSKFSNFNTIHRVTAYVMRFINKCKKTSVQCGSLTSTELNNSLNLLLKLSQMESFPEEYHLLKSGKQLPAKNKLLYLSPFFDNISNLIRVGGRLNNSFYDYNIKHPILLSSSHTICILLFNMFHLRLLHAGPQLLLATVRHHYYPIGGRNLAKKVTHQCVKCCRVKANTIQPIMGNLPKQRLHLEFPFLDTGIDYAGPVMIADRKGRGCRLIKCFICVFVCLATRAIHLELVSDLTKEAFLAALNRFIARRGKPRNIFSDNGTTFVGAFNELAKLLSQDLNVNTIDPGIHFSFIPAYTPHFGGLWESAVKSTKHHLRRILGLTNLNFEEMATCLIQVEAILNSRPLTPLSNDPSDLAPLTPAHFLIGRSLIMLPHSQVQNANINSLKRFHRIDVLKQHFWTRFAHEYIMWLQERTKWRRSSGELKEGTMVVIKDNNLPPLMWLLGRITHVLPGRDGVARVADILTKKGVIRRAFNTICPLPVSTVEDSSTGGVC
ncbi:uncharacterized protein LOC111357037 isoform X1 [Spodoptera litura]|uniref:Uncharacterized protein LOC111357037 isoform X1 n=1 Tax=Spodoptera litura TaxID=69820 RepID=A0A9J7IXY7_SPOLT|nr:uncharacterized protein LOC111357037 isoform X1 [Spodoptera litura]